MTAGSTTVTTSETLLYEAATMLGCSEFVVKTISGEALVNIPGLHAEGDWFPIPSGDSQTFKLLPYGIKSVRAKGNGGDAVLNFGIVSN